MPRVAACNPMFVKYAGKKRFWYNKMDTQIKKHTDATDFVHPYKP